MKRVSLLAIIGFFSFSSFAIIEDTIRLDTPFYGGSGCPAGSASASLSPDSSSATILFDQFVIETGGNTGKRGVRKSCNIGVPVHVPQGLTVSVFKIDYRGFNNLPYGAFSEFSVEYFFAGSRGSTVTQKFKGPISDNYLISSELIGQTTIWSPCGKDVILRANAGMFVKTTPFLAEAMSTLDSMDIKSGIQYHLKWASCSRS
jgi:Domain of unknown function (DUF4360)